MTRPAAQHRSASAPARRAALTLVEVIISVLLVSTLIVMMLGTFSALARSQRTQASRTTARFLADQLLSEVLQNQYMDANSPSLGLESGESSSVRANTNDVDDYASWSESPPKYRNGAAIPGFTGWRRAVSVSWIDPGTLAASGTDQGLKKVIVTVTDPQGRAVSATALRSRNGAFDQKPDPNTTAVRWVGVELQVGGDASCRVYAGACVPNLVPG